jgi:predicted nucleic acid-binding protein
MTAKAKKIRTIPLSAFWDTSAIVPLCCYQPQSTNAARVGRLYCRRTVWWATRVEAVSSFQRLLRNEELSREGLQQALERLDRLRQSWNEVQPTDEIREIAERLLGVHKLRAADALQLAAAQVWCRRLPHGRHFVGADGNLSDAAENEGFTVVRLL